MGVFRQQVGVELRLAAQLHDTLGQFVSVLGFLGRMFQELIGSHAGLEAVGHEVVTLVAQHADQFSGQRLVEQSDDFLTVGVVAFGHGTVFDVLAGAAAQGRNVSQLCLSHFNLLGLIRLYATLCRRDRYWL